MSALTWFDWFLVLYFIIGIVGVHKSVGEPRVPVTPKLSKTVLVMNLIVIVLLILTRNGVLA